MPASAVQHIVLDLVAFGPQPENRWRHRIVEGEIVRLGRAPRHGLRVAWDMMISREHAELTVTSDQLHVKCLETARNPIVSQKKPYRELTLGSGESFQIGSTTFTVEVTRPLSARSSDNALDSMEIVEEYTFSPVSMQSVKFGNADLRLEVLSKLPRVFAESRDEKTLANRLVALLLEGLPRARAAAVLKFQDARRVDNPEVNYWDVRGGDARHFHPSRRLMQATLSQGDSRLHILSESASSRNAVTMQENLDWAFCTPLLVAENEAWCLYASGQVFAPDLLTMEQDLRGDVRFTELLAQFLSSFRQVCRLQRQQVALSQFFSPAVMETLIGGQAAVLLTPRESDITVLFCDVRGFSRAAEESPHALGELLERISRALSVMTRGIVRYDGVIADFQGDAALGFWGWPVAMEDGPLPACRAALYIDSIFREAALDQQHALVDFRVGIGIAHGRAIAGNIGAVEQSKVGAFGPVVNLGSRLEGLAKQLGVPIILDEATAGIVRTDLSPAEGRCRRVVRLRPQGMRTPVFASELLPPEGLQSPLTDQDLADYGRSLEAFMSGDWEQASRLLAGLPAEDGAARYLLGFMAEHHGHPPQDWDGTINLKSK